MDEGRQPEILPLVDDDPHGGKRGLPPARGLRRRWSTTSTSGGRYAVRGRDRMAECPCGTGRDYDACCGAYISGTSTAETAEALMRSRYTAFARGEVDFLTETIHPQAREGYNAEEVREWSKSADWLGFEVLSTSAGQADDDNGSVEFMASYRVEGKVVRHHEMAEFRKEDGTWYFFDGKFMSQSPLKRDQPKVGRNDPCPCGSGKKYKKCCGATTVEATP
jgi:SEC-C motif-containing protein